jgi:SAM-dependent methyltransferase
MTAPLGIYGAALRQAARGLDGIMHVVDEAGGRVRRIDPLDWTIELRPGDRSLLTRCAGPTLDVGCGPGRLTAALTRAGHSALGIDISAEAVRQARRRLFGVRAACSGTATRASGTASCSPMATSASAARSLLGRFLRLPAARERLVEISARRPGLDRVRAAAIARHTATSWKRLRR